MNIAESAAAEQLFIARGWKKAASAQVCDVAIINSCSIRKTAEERIEGRLGWYSGLKKVRACRPDAKAKLLEEAAEYVKDGPKPLTLVFMGCMAERLRESIKKDWPCIDYVVGTFAKHHFGEIIDAVEEKRTPFALDDTESYKFASLSYEPGSFSCFVPIMHGCNNFCTYCIVPYVRGRERSRDMKSIISECEKLINDGYKEITLLGQNVNSYGNDVPDENVNFANLLREVAKIDGKFRIRFMTSHPKDLTEDVVKAIRDNDKICNNIHLPIQAGSNSVLKNMNRRYTREHYLGLIDMIRRYLPDCGITTDIMVGFPYETEEDFLDTMDIVEKVRFSTAFTFIYSVRKGTKAAEMPQIPYEIKQNRIKRLIARQNEITEEISKDYVGNVYEILVEGMQEKKNGYVVGRTESGRLVSAKGDESMIGEFKNVKITAVKNAQLLGEIL